MPTYTFPVQITLTEPLETGGEAQVLAVRIEQAVREELDNPQQRLCDPDARVIVMQPVPGFHHRTITD